MTTMFGERMIMEIEAMGRRHSCFDATCVLNMTVVVLATNYPNQICERALREEDSAKDRSWSPT